MTAKPKIAAAQRAADWLADNGQPVHAEAVRSLCRSNGALHETCSRLSLDNAALRGNPNHGRR
jgi:hypothetical protein